MTINLDIFKLLKSIEKNFESKLQEKTGWGRNDVIRVYKDAVLEEVLNTNEEIKDNKHEPL